jgi:hypothetical protein
MSTPTFEKYAWAEHAWLSYPTSRQYHPELAKFIINNSPNKKNIEYMGAYIIPLKPEYADAFISPETKDVDLDIIHISHTVKFKSTKKFGKYQSIFSSLDEFAKKRIPPKNKIGVYFFGEVHNKNRFIHWNVAFLKPDKIDFFDPVLDMKSYKSNADMEYDFRSRTLISQSFNVEQEVILSIQRPQWVCRSNNNFTDLFCQTWTLLFLDIYCHNHIDEFVKLDFKQYQTEIVKTWLVCTINKLKHENEDWDLFSKEELQSFPYCLKRGSNNKPIVSELNCYIDDIESCAEMITVVFKRD